MVSAVCLTRTRTFPALCACCLCLGAVNSMSRAWVTCPRRDAALGYYTAALKGAARVASSDFDSQSSSFRRLARLHFRAVELRRQKKWDGASNVYRAAIGLYRTMPPAKEVPSFAAAACTWLNLALTEKNNGHFDAARRVFQDGTRFVQEQMQKELDVRIDGQHRVRSGTQVQASSRDIQVACKWLATLLVSWGLLETQRGWCGAAKLPADDPNHSAESPGLAYRCCGHASMFLSILAVGIFVANISTLWDSSLSTAWATPRSPSQESAVGYYTAALRGAATVTGPESSAFQRLARLHYHAVQLRRERKWAGASAVYRTAIALQEHMPPAKEVPACAAAACTWLNLALTEQNNLRFDKAREAFQNGTQYVQETMQKELKVWIDGQSRLRSRTLAQAECADVAVACKWLATLLVAWGLLETKRGFRARAKVLAERAATLDGNKAKVLSWKVIQGL
ncbi:unnamed protein product [Symbiodinium sp. CCMP2592]|nr:unnamed protein product [Symbiodinium sp. CCMP2592]